MYESFHDTDFAKYFVQIFRVQLSLVDNFDGDFGFGNGVSGQFNDGEHSLPDRPFDVVVADFPGDLYVFGRLQVRRKVGRLSLLLLLLFIWSDAFIVVGGRRHGFVLIFRVFLRDHRRLRQSTVTTRFIIRATTLYYPIVLCIFFLSVTGCRL